MAQIAHVSRFEKDSPCGQSVCEPQWANACGQLAVCCLLLPAFTSFLQLQPCVSHVSAMCQPCTELQCADASCITNYQLIVRLYYHSFWCNILAICWSHEDKMCLTTNSMSVSCATAACVCVCICAEWHLHMMQHVYVYVYVQSGICIWCSTGMCMYICRVTPAYGAACLHRRHAAASAIHWWGAVIGPALYLLSSSAPSAYWPWTEAPAAYVICLSICLYIRINFYIQ